MASDTSMYIKQNDFTLQQPIEGVTFVNQDYDDPECMYIHLDELSGKFETKEFHAHYGVLGAHGAAHVSMDHTHLTVGYKFTRQWNLEYDGTTIPGILPCKFGWDLTKKNLGFKVSGSFWDGFIDMFKNTFEDDIANAIISKVQDELVNKIPAEFNKMIADTYGKVELMPKWMLDITEAETGVIDADSINLGIKALLYDSDFAEPAPTMPTAMPYRDTAMDSELQAFVSQETISSALTSFLQVHPIEGWFNATEAPEKMTTGFLEKAFKGISDYYGPDCPVNVQYKLKSLHDLAIDAASPDLTLFGDIDLKFWVDGVNGTDLAVDLAANNFEFQGQVSIVNETQLQCNITKLKVKNIVVNSDTFGKIGTFKLQMGLNVALAVLAPKIEGKIDHIALPTSLLKNHLTISDLMLSYYDGYLGFGATPGFVAPPLPPAPVDAHEASTVCVENKAGFVLQWHFEDTYTGEHSDSTEHYPIDKTHCMDLKTAFPNIREGEVVNTVVKATAGKTLTVQHSTTYKADAGLFTTFTCRGTTLHYHCNDEFDYGVSAEDQIAEDAANLITAFFQ